MGDEQKFLRGDEEGSWFAFETGEITHIRLIRNDDPVELQLLHSSPCPVETLLHLFRRKNERGIHGTGGSCEKMEGRKSARFGSRMVGR